MCGSFQFDTIAAAPLIRLLDRLWTLLLSKYTRKKKRKEEVEIQQLEEHLLPEQKLKALFPCLRNIPKRATGKWIIPTESKMEPYKLIDTLILGGKVSVRHTAQRIMTSSAISHKGSLTLIEYRYPTRKRWSLSGEEEVLFAKLTMATKQQTRNIADFYIAVGASCKWASAHSAF
ncbi:MAG: hypothetical protein RR921_06915 [Mucinivorans sp.]